MSNIYKKGKIRIYSFFRSLFKRFGEQHVHPYFVLALDLVIVFLCSLIIPLSGFLLFGTSFDTGVFFSSTSLIIVVYTICFYIFKTYIGIVRYSDYKDILRFSASVIFATFVLIANNVLVEFITGDRIFTYNIFIVFIGLAVMFCSIMLKTFTKVIYAKSLEYMYGNNNNNNNNKSRAIILGTDNNSVSMAKTIKDDVNSKYIPVGFLWTKEERYVVSKIDTLPIKRFVPEKVKSVFEKLDASVLLFDPSQINILRNGGIDVFLDADIKVLQVSSNMTQHRKEDSNVAISCNVQDIKIEDLLNRDVIEPDIENINHFIKDKVVLITGAAGSIGSEIVRQCAKYKASKIILFDNAETPMHNIMLGMQNAGVGNTIIPIIGDVRNIVRVKRVFEKYSPQVVFHAAAYKHVPMMELHPSEAIRTNVGGSKNLADLSLKYNVEKFVMISTDKAVNPTNIMGATKRLAEIYVQSLAISIRNNEEKRTKFITTRFGNVLGSNGSVVPLFKEQIANGGPVTITDKRIIRYFMTIPEACELVLEAGCMGNGGEIFVFDMGNPVKIFDLAKRMIRLSGLKPYTDIDIIETGLRPGEKLYEELLNDKEITDNTRNKRIMIGKVREYDYNAISPQIEELIAISENGNDVDIVTMMKDIVPEYISQNSRFEALDTKKE